MGLFSKEFFNWNTRDDSYFRPGNFYYGPMSSDIISDLVTSRTKAIYFDFQIRSESESSFFPRNSDYRDGNYNFYYDLFFSNQDTMYKKKLFSRHLREYGTTGLFGDFKEELEELDEPKIEQGLRDYFRPLLKYLSENNELRNEDSALDGLFRTICSAKPVLNREEPNRVCYKKRVVLNFLDSITAKERKEESRIKEKESALFDGSMKWISFRFHFEHNKGAENSKSIKLVLTIINSKGASIEYDVFDFRCNIENSKAWRDRWVSFVKTEGKIKILQILNRLSRYHECVSDLLELKSINSIIDHIIGYYDLEIPITFSCGSESERKGKKERSQKTQNDQTSIWLGLLGLESMPDSLDELKKAYRNACFAFHPDRFTDAGKKKWAEEQLKKISNAFDELSKLYM